MGNKICTSIEQSKKLLKLGIDVNTADMRYGYIAPYDYSDRMFDGGYDEVPYPKDFLKKNPNFYEDEYDSELPAWSLTALLDVLPFYLTVNNQIYGFNMMKGLDKNGETYAIRYTIFNTTFHLHLTDYYNDPIDAAFEMICWLKENNRL